MRIDAGAPLYEMYLRDHLGNNRIMFADLDEDGELDPSTEVMQEAHFYPFGLSFSGASSVAAPAVPNQYLFTGKETQDEMGIGWIDFGARMYDASVERWNGVDPHAENYLTWTPYNYVGNSPIIRIDPNGMDWKIISETTEDGKIHIKFKFTGAILNNSKVGFDPTKFEQAFISQLQNAFKGDDDDFSFETEVSVRTISSADELSFDEHLIEIVDEGKQYGNSFDNGPIKSENHWGSAPLGGKRIFINSRYVEDIINGVDQLTVSHEAGHTAGLYHSDMRTTLGDMMNGRPFMPFNQRIPLEDKEAMDASLMTSYPYRSKQLGHGPNIPEKAGVKKASITQMKIIRNNINFHININKNKNFQEGTKKLNYRFYN